MEKTEAIKLASQVSDSESDLFTDSEMKEMYSAIIGKPPIDAFSKELMLKVVKMRIEREGPNAKPLSVKEIAGVIEKCIKVT